MKFNKRYIAHITIEADTPLNISSGETDALTDSLVAMDANGLPLIPGTSLTGVLRSALLNKMEKDTINKLFGYQGSGNDGQGSRVIISNAHFIGKDGNVIEGLQQIDFSDDFYAKFLELPVREHCKMTHKGTAKEHGKFDNQVVYKGTRFKFSIELIDNGDDENRWTQLLDTFKMNSFRIGGGSRKGYGKLKVISIHSSEFDDIHKYLEISSSLNTPLKYSSSMDTNSISDEDWLKYSLYITPETFYQFGSGFGDEEVDMTPVYEEIVKWNDGKPSFSDKMILVPASAIKGALSHRVAYYYNKLKEIYAENILPQEEIEKHIGENNFAVATLFGFSKDSKAESDKDKKVGQRGNCLLSDCFKERKKNAEKILNHVAIDRFTGGGRDGALFDEKVIVQNDEYNIEILVYKNALQDNDVKKAFELGVNDIITGMLPLGGGVLRGHGCFNGKCIPELNVEVL